MLKAITCPAILTSASTRADGSLGLRFATPELDASSKTAFFELLNKNLKLLIQPESEEPTNLHEVKGQFDRKTPGQRLRSVLFVRFSQTKETTETFDDYYLRRMNQIIEAEKKFLDEPQPF